MQQISQPQALREQVRVWRESGKRIGFVPTMGNLHAGHLQLVAEAMRQCDHVVVSIFVNPLQFGRGEDLDEYPRTPRQDVQRLQDAGVDLLFTPAVSEMYPRELEQMTRVQVPGLSDILCGIRRPGHFDGVCTIVSKLFKLVQADVAFFGEKDFQQLCIIRRMVEDLNLPIEVVGVATVREPDGLAMSSRNQYLTPAQREQAPRLMATLKDVAERLLSGEENWLALEHQASVALSEQGFRVDYVSIRQPDLGLPTPGRRPDAVVILVAATIGTTRLIDNLRITLQ